MKRILCCLLLISVLISCITLVSVNAAEDYGLHLPYTHMTYGDADGNGQVDAIDTTYMMRYLVRMRNPHHFCEYYGLYHFGDVDCDGYITIMDVSHIQRYLAYLPTSSHAGIWESTDSEIEVHNAKNMGIWMHNNGFTNPQIAGLLSFLDSQGIFYQISDFDYYFSSLRNGATFGKFNLLEYKDKLSYNSNPDMLADYVASSWIYSEEMGTMAWSNHFSAYDTMLYESKFYELTADSWNEWAYVTF